MTIENDFLPFAAGAGANVLTQAQYAALTSLIANGFSAGVAPSAQLNKVWRQGSIMASVLAQFIVANTGQTAIDDGTTATLLANLATAISVTARQNPVLADTGAVNACVVSNLAAFAAYPTSSGLTLDVSIANANTGASTLNVDGLGAKPILGLGLQPLQGGELVAKGVACLLYVVASTVNSGNGAWIVMECSGGAQQVAPATQSNHAVNLGQLFGGLKGIQRFTANGSLTAPAGVTTLYLSGCAGGAGGGGGAGVSGVTSGTASGGGGGGGQAGQFVIRQSVTVTPGQVLTVTIGGAGSAGSAGAAGANGGNGTAGGNTSLTGTGVSVSLSGGQPGVGGSTPPSNNSGGVGGAPGGAGAGSGDYGLAVSGYGTNKGGDGGKGGETPFGAGGATIVNGAGQAGQGYGAGGSGGSGSNTASSAPGFSAGAGAPGILILEW